MGLLKHLLKLLQFFAVVMIPLAAIQHYVKILDFVENFNTASLNFFSTFTTPIINGTDFTLIFLILPWVFLIIICGMLVNLLDNIGTKTGEMLSEYKTQKVSASLERQKQRLIDELQKKNMIYLVAVLNFSKFTISNLSEQEIHYKKQEIKEKLYKDVETYKGKLLEDEKFEDEDTAAFVFFSQEDALHYIFKLKEMISYMDNDIQSFGYTLNYRIILDAQTPDASAYDVLLFLEKALKTVEMNELCTTNSFADKYKNYGSMKHINFHSKGTYSINKQKVELNRLQY